jgi:hypothetical protein
VSGSEQNGAHRRHGAVYFTELSVANVRCFGPEQRLSLVDGDRPAKWTVILGENGVGKTAADSGEYASMVRSLLRHVAPWRDAWTAPGPSLLDALRADAARGLALQVPET